MGENSVFGGEHKTQKPKAKKCEAMRLCGNSRSSCFKLLIFIFSAENAIFPDFNADCYLCLIIYFMKIHIV